MINKYTFAFDLDGVLCQHIRNNHPEDILKVNPIDKWVNVLKELKEKKHEIVIFTRRGILPKGRKLTIEWLKKHNIPYDKLITNKPHYTMLIDDRAYEIYRSGVNGTILINAAEVRRDYINKITYVEGK